MALNIPDGWYVACFTANDGIYGCGHRHPSIPEAMLCIVPDGGSFIRASENGILRSLNEGEEHDAFLGALSKMPWSWRNKTAKRAG
jgi:hypothetical protein